MKYTGYAVWQDHIGGADLLPISEGDYQTLAKSRNGLSEYTRLEELFLLICQAYKSLELFNFETTLDDMLFNASVSELHLKGTMFSAESMAFLSTARLYLDRVVHYAKCVSDGKITESMTKRHKSSIFDTCFEYRVMEMLRNHSQHHSLLVGAAQYGGRKSEKDGAVTEYFSDFYVNVEDVLSNKQLTPKTTIKEISTHKTLDLKLCARVYFSKLCLIHAAIRSDLENYVEQYERDIASLRLRWRAAYPGDSLTGVVAGRLVEDLYDNSFEKYSLSEQLDEHRLALVARTSTIGGTNMKRVIW